MKTLSLCLCAFLTLPQLGLAGGFSSIVEIGNVTSINVEAKKITITGGGVIKRRVMSTAEKGDATVFGQPAQMVHAKVKSAVFEIVPYFTPDIEGVPTGGHSEEELKQLSEKSWVGIHAAASKIKKGDAVTISYQGDRTTINGVRVTKVVGYGTARVRTEGDG